MDARSKRRVAAVFLPHLLCEIAEQQAAALPPPRERTDHTRLEVASSKMIGVVESPQPTSVLLAVSEAAARCGVRVGQTVAEARAMVSSLTIHVVAAERVRDALGRIAEISLSFAPCAAIELGGLQQGFSDSVWIDVTHSTHLWGDERALLSAILLRTQLLGHSARVAISDGPVLARAAAKTSVGPVTVVPHRDLERTIAAFPMDVLPLSRDLVVWFARLGIWSLGDLRQLPARAALPRLGDSAQWVLDLVHGRDETPLEPYHPLEYLREQVEWDESVDAIEPLLFVLRALTTRMGVRLEARGEAAQVIECWAPYDAAFANHAGLVEPAVAFRVELPSPLAHEQDLFRVYKSKLERHTLLAPVTGLSITASSLVPRSSTQLELGGDISVGADPRALPLLLAELSAQIGDDKVGVFEVREVHKPEAKSVLVAARTTTVGSRDTARQWESSGAAEVCSLPSRLLAQPVPLPNRPVRGSTVAIGRRVYQVDKVSHPVRFDGLDWWTHDPVSRDYVRVLLRADRDVIEAWTYTDRVTGDSYLHGYYD